MTNREILEEIALGEDRQRLFKACLFDSEQLAAEICCIPE